MLLAQTATKSGVNRNAKWRNGLRYRKVLWSEFDENFIAASLDTHQVGVFLDGPARF